MQTPTSFYNNRFESIQTLRGIAAVLVVLEHIRFLNCGAFGVDIFFCISGFMMMYTTQNSTEHFFRKRLIRIVPFYYLMTLGTYALLLLFPGMFQQTEGDISFLVKSLLFIPFDIGDGVLQPLLRIGWTVNCEMFFYLLFFLSFHISHRFRGLVCSLLLLGISGLNTLLAADWAPLRFYGNPVMLEFAMGMLCYEIARRLYALQPKSKTAARVSLFSGCILLLLLALTKSHVNVLDWRRLLIWGLPAMLILLLFFTAGLNLHMPKWSVRLGDISFSLYLIHYYPILFIDRKLCDFSVYSPSALLGAVCSTLLTIALAIIAWYLIEKRFTGWLLHLNLNLHSAL